MNIGVLRTSKRKSNGCRNKDDKGALESKLIESKAHTLELEKLKHDLEVELEDFKEENRVQQHVNDSELKVWNEKIRKKKEILEVEQELVDKRKQKIEHLEQQNTKLKDQLSKIDVNETPKTSADELRRLRDEIQKAKKEAKVVAKKNKEKIQQKEQEVAEAKYDMNKLVDQLEELNKQYRVNLHKCNQNDRVIKYGLYKNDSQINLMYGTKTSSSRKGVHSQYRSSNYGNYKKNSMRRRDLSAIQDRKVGKIHGSRFNMSKVNSSMESDSSRMYANGFRNNVSTNKLKAAKLNSKTNASVVYGNDPKDKMEVGPAKADRSVNDIKLTDTNSKNEASNIKAHTEADAKNNNLGELKGLKTTQKKKIETSVKL